MRIGFVVPALTQEAGLLVDCIANLHSICEMIPEAVPVIIVILQGQGPAPALPASSAFAPPTLIHVPYFGVAMARNQALDRIEGQVDAVMFVDVSVRPSACFLRAALVALSSHPLVSAPVAFTHTLPLAVDSPRIATMAFRSIVFRGFIWSTLFRADWLRGTRFVATMGPGTASPHQAGEDSRLLFAIWRLSGLGRIAYLPDCPVARLPRTDLAAKVERYARGQGWLVGRYARLPGLSVVDRLYFAGRALLFITNSFRLFLSARQRPVARARLSAFWAGWMDKDPTAPPLV